MTMDTLASDYKKMGLDNDGNDVEKGNHFNRPCSEFQAINNVYPKLEEKIQTGAIASGTTIDIYIHSSPKQFCHGCLLTLLQLKIALKSHNINARIHASSDGAPTFEILPRILNDHGQAAITDMIGILTEHLNDNYDNVVADHGLQQDIDTFFGILADNDADINEAIDLLKRDFEDWRP